MANLSVDIDENLNKDIRDLAKAHRRSISNMVEIILADSRGPSFQHLVPPTFKFNEAPESK